MATGYIQVCCIFQFMYLAWVVYSRNTRNTSDIMAKRDDDYAYVGQPSQPHPSNQLLPGDRVIHNDPPPRSDIVIPDDPELGRREQHPQHTRHLEDNYGRGGGEPIRHQKQPTTFIPAALNTSSHGSLVVWEDRAPPPKPTRTRVTFSPAPTTHIIPGKSKPGSTSRRTAVQFVPAHTSVVKRGGT